MKLIVQIPAWNEQATIGAVIQDIPRVIAGIDAVEVLIIDDGSTDATVDEALAHGADHVVRHVGNKGLAAAFQTGIDACLRLGADIIVNTDADGQYPGREIARLVEPILARRAEYVIGDRQTDSIEHFSPLKKALQRVGSGVVRWVSGTNVPDTVSGFRALTREAALRMFVMTDFSYTVENLVQAGKKRLTIETVAITTNVTDRPSRLHSGNWNFIKRQAAIILRSYTRYEPLKAFTYLAAPFLILGSLLLLRAFYVFIGRRYFDYFGTNEQSLTGGAVLVLLGALIFIVGILADIMHGARRVSEEALYRIRKREIEDAAWRRRVEQQLAELEEQKEEREVR